MPDSAYRARTLPQVVADAAAEHGERVAITDADAELTYAELDAARVRSARAFVAAGLEKGDRVAIWAPNIYQWIIAAIGAQSIGGVVVPMNTRYKGSEAAYVIDASGARMLFTVGDFLGVNYPAMLADQAIPSIEQIVTLQGEAEGAQRWDDFLAAGETVPEGAVAERAAAVTPDDTLDILFPRPSPCRGGSCPPSPSSGST